MSVLLTGASGYLGRQLAATRAATPDDGLGDQIVPLVRAPDQSIAEALAAIDPGQVTHIVHTAAITRFNVDYETARRVNLDGTISVAEFAERCPRLERFTHVSTLYVSGRHTGDIRPEQLADLGFVNHYEWSKHAAETVLLERARDRGLPLRIIRLPTLIADDDTGMSVGQYNAFHNTLKLYYFGLLSLVPGDLDTPLALGSAEYTIRAMLAAPDTGITHACPAPADTITLGELIDIAFNVFEKEEAFRRRRLLRPLACDLASFKDLVQVADGFKGGPINQALGSVSPFAEQLYLPKVFLAPRARPVDTRRLVENICATLVETRFGRNER
jgi:nucleoside-diphosphate-sugar epimerase